MDGRQNGQVATLSPKRPSLDDGEATAASETGAGAAIRLAAARPVKNPEVTVAAETGARTAETEITRASTVENTRTIGRVNVPKLSPLRGRLATGTCDGMLVLVFKVIWKPGVVFFWVPSCA